MSSTALSLPSLSHRETFDIPYGNGQPAVLSQYDNGYTFIHVPKSGDVFNISTWVRTGSIHENDENSGISHFLEHLMFKGTERFKVGEFDRAMESMGAIINAATWKDFTFYYVTGPNLKQAVATAGQQSAQTPFERALDMHADMMTGSLLPDDEIGQAYDADNPDPAITKRERGVVIEEIGMRGDQPWTKVYNALNHMMYPEQHPYQRDVIGTRQIIGSIPREAIQTYHAQWYRPETFITIVVGDFELETLEPMVLKAFHALDNPSVKALPESAVDTTEAEKVVEKLMAQQAINQPGSSQRETIVKGDVATTFFMLGFHSPRPSDLKAAIALDVAGMVLGGGRSSRMHQQLVEKPENPAFTFVGCGQQQFKLGNVFFIQGNTILPDTDMALEMVRNLLRQVLTDQPITDDECQRTLKKLKADFAETSETASGIADAIGESLTVTGSLDYYLKYLDTLSTITTEDVNKAVQTYLNPNKAYTAVLEPNMDATSALA